MLKKKNKYGNKKVVVDGFKFDSKKEAKRYGELRMLLRAKLITGLSLQPKFEIIPTIKHNGETLRKIFYIADFKYFHVAKDRWIVEDSKGFKTKDYNLKKRLFLIKYPEYVFIES